MATSKVLQVPQITSIDGSTIRVAHPDVASYTRTRITTNIAAAGTTLSVADNNNFADNDWFIEGEIGDPKTESGDVNGAVTRGTSLTITNTNSFAHEIDAPVTRIQERGFAVYGAATDGGAGTIIESVDAETASGRQLADAIMIQWDKDFSEFTIISTDTSYAYYYVTFKDGTTESDASDYVLASGPAFNSASELIKAGLREVDAVVDGNLITNEWLLDVMNDWQDEVTHYVTQDGVSKDWSFEIAQDDTSLTILQNKEFYALSGLSSTIKYPDSYQGVLQVKVGDKILDHISFNEMQALYDGKKRTEVATEASAADTSIVLDDTYEFAENGTVSVGSDTVTYTTNTESTSTLSGIPASGTGSITATWIVNTPVWQGVSPGVPKRYSIFNGNIFLDYPANSTIVNYKIKMKYLFAISRLTSLSETTVITISHIAKYYIGARIESRKGNLDNSERLMAKHAGKLEAEARKDRLQVMDQTDYYNFATHSTDARSRERRDWFN